MGAFETTQLLRGTIFVNLDFLMTTYTYQDTEEIEIAKAYIKAVLRLIVKYFQLLPNLIEAFNQASIDPELFLVDENIAVALSYNELLYMLSNIFGKHFKALKFFTKLDTKPTETDDFNVTEPFLEYEEFNLIISENNEADRFYSMEKEGNLVFGSLVDFVRYFSNIRGF